MGTVCKRRLSAVIFVTVVVFMAVSPAITVDAQVVPSDLNIGPYVDSVFFTLNTNYAGRILNLLAGTTEMDLGFFDLSDLLTLEADPDISLSSQLRNGYGHITINCRKYPLNISAFRRAFAFAFDKTRVTSELLPLGILSQEHDSVVPYSNDWCIEDDLLYHYYTAQVATGAAILDAAGFTIDPYTGYRLAPDGSPFDVSIQWTNTTPIATDVGIIVSQAAVDALTALDIDATIGPIWWDLDNLMKRIDNNEDFDMAFYAYNFPDNDVDWLGYHFWGELADVPFANPCNFRNTTYDSWRTQLLHSTEYEEVYEAAAAMQMILHENVPLVVVYENIYKHPYRNDLFTGFTEDLGRGIAGTWTLRKIHRIDGTPGGLVRIVIADYPDTFNIYLPSNTYASSIMAELWPSLYLEGPDRTPVPYLAENMIIETHADNPSIQRDRTRFTVDIIQNAEWTDGTPVTAEDVVFSLKYAFESGVHGNPAGIGLTYLLAAYTPSTYRTVLEFEAESYWHFSNFAFNYIIPEHIFNDVDGIGYEGWNSWDPVFWNLSMPHTTSGPFELTDYVYDDFCRISANPDFWYYPTTIEPEILIAPAIDLLFNTTLVLAVSGVGAAVVIHIGGTILFRRK